MGDGWWWIMEIVSGIIMVGVVFKYSKEYTKKHNPSLGVCTGCWHEGVLLYYYNGKMLCAGCVEKAINIANGR